MALELYRQLIDDICSVALIPCTASLYHSTNLAIRDIDFSMQYSTGSKAGGIAILCDFGPLPNRRREEILLRLLETNFYMSESPATPMLSFNDQSERVTLTCRMPLQSLRAEVLLGLLGELADMAKSWRSSYFLSGSANSKARHDRSLTGRHHSALSASTLPRG